VNLFDYVASVLSYFIIAIPILAGKYDELSTADLASVISKVLIFASQTQARYNSAANAVWFPGMGLHSHTI